MELMKCGHTAQGHDGNGKPVCVICNCKEIEESKPYLTGRVAECDYCRQTKPSSFDLPFFEYRPDKDTDKYYCGCKGWD